MDATVLPFRPSLKHGSRDAILWRKRLCAVASEELTSAVARQADVGPPPPAWVYALAAPNEPDSMPNLLLAVRCLIGAG